MTFISLLAVFLFPLVPDTPYGQLAVKATTFFMPWASWWFTMESKMLMHLSGGTPFHMSWVDLGIGTKFTEITTDITFFGATMSLTVIVPGLLVVLALYFVGSPFAPFGALQKAKTMREVTGPLRKMMVQQLVLLVGFTGGWMILVSSGLPMPTKFLTEMAGVPPLLPVDTRVAVQVHRYDLVGAMFLVYVGLMLADCPPDRLWAVKVSAPLSVGAMWFYSIAVKVRAAAAAAAAGLAGSTSAAWGMQGAALLALWFHARGVAAAAAGAMIIWFAVRFGAPLLAPVPALARLRRAGWAEAGAGARSPVARSLSPPPAPARPLLPPSCPHPFLSPPL